MASKLLLLSFHLQRSSIRGKSLPNVPIWSLFVQMLITDRPAGQSKAGCGNQIPSALSLQGLPTNDHQWARATRQINSTLEPNIVSWEKANANIGEAAAASTERKRKVTLIRIRRKILQPVSETQQLILLKFSKNQQGLILPYSSWLIFSFSCLVDLLLLLAKIYFA